jgi:hypothetical protein
VGRIDFALVVPASPVRLVAPRRPRRAGEATPGDACIVRLRLVRVERVEPVADVVVVVVGSGACGAVGEGGEGDDRRRGGADGEGGGAARR